MIGNPTPGTAIICGDLFIEYELELRGMGVPHNALVGTTQHVERKLREQKERDYDVPDGVRMSDEELEQWQRYIERKKWINLRKEAEEEEKKVKERVKEMEIVPPPTPLKRDDEKMVWKVNPDDSDEEMYTNMSSALKVRRDKKSSSAK